MVTSGHSPDAACTNIDCKGKEPLCYAMYRQETEIYACGPFPCKRDALLWFAGFRAAENTNIRPLGVVADIASCVGITIYEPDLLAEGVTCD